MADGTLGARCFCVLRDARFSVFTGDTCASLLFGMDVTPKARMNIDSSREIMICDDARRVLLSGAPAGSLSDTLTVSDSLSFSGLCA